MAFFRYEQVERRAIWYFNNNKEEETVPSSF
jgi:hypothetical protein